MKEKGDDDAEQMGGRNPKEVEGEFNLAVEVVEVEVEVEVEGLGCGQNCGEALGGSVEKTKKRSELHR